MSVKFIILRFLQKKGIKKKTWRGGYESSAPEETTAKGRERIDTFYMSSLAKENARILQPQFINCQVRE